jgi:hypothetical protein
MTNNANPALYCTRCAFRPATRHVWEERICNECLTGQEHNELATYPVWQPEETSNVSH